jgi:hypothetical protein
LRQSAVFPVASKERGAGRDLLTENERKKILEKRLRKRFSGDYFIPQPTLASIVILKCCPQDPGFR